MTLVATLAVVGALGALLVGAYDLAWLLAVLGAVLFAIALASATRPAQDRDEP